MSNKKDLIKQYMSILLDRLWVDEQETPCVYLQIYLNNLHRIISDVPTEILFEEQDYIYFKCLRDKYVEIVLTVLSDISNIENTDNRWLGADWLNLTLNDILSQEDSEEYTKGFLLDSDYWVELADDNSIIYTSDHPSILFFESTMERLRQLILKQRELDKI